MYVFTVMAVKWFVENSYMDPKRIGEMVRFHRKISGLSQEKLADLAGLGKTVIFDIEHGKLSIQLDTLLKVFKVLNIQVEFHGPLIPLFKEQIGEKS